MNFRNELSSNEKVAREIVGSDTEAIITPASELAADASVKQAKVDKFNDAVDELCEKFDSHISEIQAACESLAKDMQGLELMPVNSYVLVSPFETNPFQRVVKKNGIITDLGGLTPTYKSQESGKIEEEKQFIQVGVVMETGPDCKFVKPGDMIFWAINSEIPVPFYKFGFRIVSEQRVIAVANEGLTARKEEIINSKPKD